MGMALVRVTHYRECYSPLKCNGNNISVINNKVYVRGKK